MFQDCLARTTADSKHEMQLTVEEGNGSRVDVKIHSQAFEIVQETLRRGCNDCNERINAIEQELREMKTKI